jgi:hypothetical protein
MLAAVSNSPALGLDQRATALVSVIQAGLTTLLLFLPRPQEKAVVSPTPVERVDVSHTH